MVMETLIGYATPTSMHNRYHNPNYAYKYILDRIRNIPYTFGMLTTTERENYYRYSEGN